MKMKRSEDRHLTSKGDPRGYIQPEKLEELWFHTGTSCNLRCPFCLEGSGPGDQRIEFLTLNDAIPFLAEALELGVKKFSFTGGEPFANPDIVLLLAAALKYRPCLVLTNATEPLRNRLGEILFLRDKPHLLSFRVSLDYPDPARHDAARGKGTFKTALASLGRLHREGFGVSIARRVLPGEDGAAVDRAYGPFFQAAGLPEDTPIIRFPEFHRPGALPEVPEISETCMTRYLNAEQRAAFMCNFSKMIVKQNGRCGVYACTLVDDAVGYHLGPNLREAMDERVLLGHHRCYSCFAGGASCSEGR